MVTGRFRAFAIAACIGMLLVLLAGALVTNTESGRGCGDDWPLCHGKFIPAYTLESMIEYSHRVVSALEGILVLGVAIAVYRKYKKNREDFREALFYSGSALFFTVVQALMGAAAVMWPQSPPIMAIHFGISLIAFAATMLLVIWTYRVKDGRQKTFVVPKAIYPRALIVSIYCYVVVYLGAFIRHTDSAGGCEGWPLCNGEVIPELSGATGAVFIHRIAALILGLMVAGLYLYIKKVTVSEEGLTKPTGWVLALIIIQVFSGALLTATIGDANVFIFTSLLHNVIVVILFGILMDVLIRSWRFREGRKNQ
ncbi:heme A synthase [Paenibacillus sp. GSMTC-2017]|uniref:COX15/CtaA family protein n=1 Tax=Paenibacillus sp. GSMTC-2017 TaxID=2794350 RepID=UPI0018DA254B|nr:COX15/CtaA family protein [Paenibacillus sp. GSMTC-2017]MBH5319206.1 heme A synthase [Paenibacillus sp. GSMTC-2017]